MKTYIKPITKILELRLQAGILNETSALRGDMDGTEQGFGFCGNEDFGWGDDEDPASWNWRK